ncbi:NAD(P)-dependent dehydrogenase (short-subunit alcohol dehydrogenase family) [Bradyrhizobium sp. USDA 4461]
MTNIPYRCALIVGAGSGISASLARALAKAGLRVGIAARNPDKLAELAAETGAQTFAVDASVPTDVSRLFAEADARLGEPDVVLYNAAARAPGPIAELDPESVRKAIEIGAFGGFLTVREAAQRMVRHSHGAILLTGASASLKGFAQSAAFAMAKFALRGLAQSVARELGPKGIHVAHFVIDGGVRSVKRPDPVERPDSTLDPNAIAQTYVDILRQPRSAWSMEVELRPWVEAEGTLVAPASQVL